MRTLTLALVMMLASLPSQATEKDIGPLVEALFHNMALSYRCQEAIGTASYNAARTGTVGALAKYVGWSQAVLHVETLDQKFKNDPRTFGKPDANRCFEMKADVMHRIDVERAKLGD